MMPRASWKGFLRLSLASCPVYLSPATTRAKSIRLNQVWVPRTEPVPEPAGEPEEEPPVWRSTRVPEPIPQAGSGDRPDDIGPATRIALQPVDRDTGEAIEPERVVKGYEYDRGRFVTFTPDELKALDLESSRTIDLATFVPRADVDPIYFNTSYYVYPDGPVAVEPYRVIAAAMAETGMAGLGKLTLSRRERMVLVEPRGSGMALVTLRSTDEVRPADFSGYQGDVDAEAVAVARIIIQRKTGAFDPSSIPRPLPGGVAGADRGEAEGPNGRPETRARAAAGRRFDGRPEAQPCAGDRRSGTTARAQGGSPRPTVSKIFCCLCPAAKSARQKRRPPDPRAAGKHEFIRGYKATVTVGVVDAHRDERILQEPERRPLAARARPRDRQRLR